MLKLSPQDYQALLDHARAALPNEGCGLLAGERGGAGKTGKIVKKVYCLENTDKSPEHFSMAPEEQFKAVADMRKNGWTLLGNFHSHPATPARPSAEDIRLAFDPALSYVIISLKAEEPVIKSYTIQKGKAAEETLEV
jgi:proteasome lid subunit RPN8/RPN11